ncbi:MAG: FUSC family protein, partial [Mesorhizobium sp.]|nr:FUSC family protein [Mesorhizobium sp.]
AGVVIIVAVVSSLFAPRPNPVQVAWGFFKGTLIALPVAFVISQYALPAFPGFGWFIVFVVPVLVPAALAMANPRRVGIATAFAINFLAFLSPHQLMVYDPGPFLAGSLSILVGELLAIGVYLLVLPAQPWATVERLVESMREDLARLCLHERIPRRTAFESLAYDRINQLLPLAQRIGRKADALFGGSIASVAVGLETLRLRKVLAAGGLPLETSDPTREFLRILARDLLVRPSISAADTVSKIRDEAAAIAGRDGAENLQTAASLRIIAVAIEDYPGFFRRA